MAIKLNILPHQTACLERVAAVFKDVKLKLDKEIHANPIIDSYDEQLKQNIQNIQANFDGVEIPKKLRSSRTEFGIDVRMETGTGKTYCYTRLMYELNKQYGFQKFIIIVPTTPIKEGTKSFIEADYAKQHFADLYPNRSLKLSVLDPQKRVSGKRKMFPQAISEFARGTRLEQNNFHALLMSSGMLQSKATMDNDYDQTLFGTYTNPYDTLKATRPIVIIDEPHKFKTENKAYQVLLEKINPQCIIRFGATFPNKAKSTQKDYNNLVYNLGACEAFNENLVKGVATQLIQQETHNDTKIKLLDIKKKMCTIRNERTGKTFELTVGDHLSIISDEFYGIDIDSVGKTDNEEIKTGVTLSNGQILGKGDQLYAGIYGNTYQDLMIRQAIVNHLQQEKENFFRARKIKTLSLFFIDSIYSYRGEDNQEGHLRVKFQQILQEELSKQIAQLGTVDNPRSKEYLSYLQSSLDDISNTNGGYFAEDNSTSDESIQKEVDQILRDKEALLSFKDAQGNWNIRRFIFSKWTLREGWDNPNVFQICKLRSSGSEISKLQEVGRGLRLPVDELGNRVSEEQFYLTYLHDYSEKDFAENLISEINNASDIPVSITHLINKVALDRGVAPANLMAELLNAEYINIKGEVLPEKAEELYSNYAEFNTGLQETKVINKSKGKSETIRIRKERFEDLKHLWKLINRKYYLKLDDISDEELHTAVVNILRTDITGQVTAHTIQKTVTKSENSSKLVLQESAGTSYELDEYLPYNEFLKLIHKNTGISLKVMHQALCTYNQEHTLDKYFFNHNTLSKFVAKFHAWFEDAFVKRFSYRALEIDSLTTALTDVNGNPKETIVQGNVGIYKDDNFTAPDNYLYDAVVYDSDKEKQNIAHSNIDQVVVFGKIPRSSIKVPLYYGGTTSPDFMYVIKKDGKYELNFIVETKDIESDSALRNDEVHRISSAKTFFEQLKADGINVYFEKQIKSDDIMNMINKLMQQA